MGTGTGTGIGISLWAAQFDGSGRGESVNRQPSLSLIGKRLDWDDHAISVVENFGNVH